MDGRRGAKGRQEAVREELDEVLVALAPPPLRLSLLLVLLFTRGPSAGMLLLAYRLVKLGAFSWMQLPSLPTTISQTTRSSTPRGEIYTEAPAGGGGVREPPTQMDFFPSMSDANENTFCRSGSVTIASIGLLPHLTMLARGSGRIVGGVPRKDYLDSGRK